MYHVYLLQSEKRTYIGMTDDPIRRLRQHNREIKGGAKATAGRTWKHVCVISGFPTRRSALQFEWMWKYMSRRTSLIGKMETMSQIWKRDYSSSTSIHFSQFSTPFFLSFSRDCSEILKKIESIQTLQLVKCPPNFHISDYNSFQLVPFPLIYKMSSIVSNIVDSAVAPVAAIAAIAAVPAAVAVVEDKKKVPRKPKTAHADEPAAVAPTAVAAAPTAVAAASTVAAAEKPSKKEKTSVPAAVAAAVAAAAAVASDGDAGASESDKKTARKPKTAAAEAVATTDSLKEVKPKKVKKAVEVEAVAPAAPAPLVSATAVVSVPAADAETTDADAEGAAPKARKEKKPRKMRVKKGAVDTHVAFAALPALDTATLDALDMAGKVALLKDHIVVLTKQVASLKASHETAAASDDESTGKKQRKKREPKTKATCPAAADGVTRFHTTLKNDHKALSNSYKADITIDGVVYPTVEHYYHCAKFLETAPEYADKIRSTANAALVKNMGRTKKVALRADWEAVQLDVMRKALRAKFAQHDDLTTLLRSTGAARLEEESPSDAYWGIGADGTGANHLGVLLAEIRTSL
jgi:ribA/ribD-fused uncharacterized protein